MTKVTQLFERFDELPIKHMFSPGEINGLITIGTVRNYKTNFFRELQEVTEYMQNLYHTGNLNILDKDIQIGLNETWDNSQRPSILEQNFKPIIYGYTENDLFKYIQYEHKIKKHDLPKLLHSLYINQFITGYNQTDSDSLLTFPNKREIRKHAMSSNNQDLLYLLQFETIQGFSEFEIIGTKK
jgi:hypothetical protein